MISNRSDNCEKRSTPRYPFSSAVMLENYKTQNWHDGRMTDYSKGGMRFETSASLEVGSEIFIGMEESPYSKVNDVFRAIVIWSREQPMHPHSFYPYSVGIKYC
jgi:hypothetical protein